MSAWTYEGYWNVVIGNYRTAQTTVEEFDLVPSDRVSLSEWLGQAEAESWRHGDGKDGSKVPAEWAGFHERALDELGSATS